MNKLIIQIISILIALNCSSCLVIEACNSSESPPSVSEWVKKLDPKKIAFTFDCVGEVFTTKDNSIVKKVQAAISLIVEDIFKTPDGVLIRYDDDVAREVFAQRMASTDFKVKIFTDHPEYMNDTVIIDNIKCNKTYELKPPAQPIGQCKAENDITSEPPTVPSVLNPMPPPDYPASESEKE